MNIYKGFQALRAGLLFFSSYFDLVTRYEVFSANSNSIINPVADVNAFDGVGRQAIHLAVETGKLGAVKVLIERFGADINSRTRNNNNNNQSDDSTDLTPLILSILNKQLEVFFYNLPLADLNLSTSNFKSPLHFAAELGNLEMVEALVALRVKMTFLRGTRQSPLHVAMTAGKVEIVEWLIKRNLGIGPVCRDRRSQLESTLHFLARQRLPVNIWIKMLEIYLKALNRNMNITTNPVNRLSLAGLTPLQIALEEENEVALVGLIVFGADISISISISQNNKNKTTITSNLLISSVREFFHGNNYLFNPDYINDQSESIWHISVRANSINLIQSIAINFLLKPNLRFMNSNGMTPLDLAINLKHFEIGEELLKMYNHVIDASDLDRLAYLFAWNSHFSLLQILIEEFPKDMAALIDSTALNRSDSFLHILIIVPVRDKKEINERGALVLVLLKYFPQIIQSRDQFGRTPMHLALDCEFLEFFTWLRKAKISNSELNFNSSGHLFLNSLREKDCKKSVHRGLKNRMTVELLQSFKDTNETLWTCAWSSNGKVLAAAGTDRIIRLYERSNFESESESDTGSCASTFALTNELKKAHTKTIRSLSFCPRRLRLSAASFDGTVSIWSGSVISSSSNKIKTLKWNCTATLEGHENEVKASAWGVFLNQHAEEEQVFLATCGRDKTVWIWAMTETDINDSDGGGDEDFECLAVLQEHSQDVKCLAWHPTEPLFITGSYDQSILAWGPLNASLDDWISVGKLAKDVGGTVWSLAFSGDGKRLAVGISSGILLIYDIPSSWTSLNEWSCKENVLFNPIPVTESSLSTCKSENKEGEGEGQGEGCCGGSTSTATSTASHTDSSTKSSGGCCKSESLDHSHSESEHEDEKESGCCGGGGGDAIESKSSGDSCCNSKKPRYLPITIPPTELYNLCWNSDSTILAVACSDHSLKILDASGSVLESIEGAHGGEINSLAWCPVDSNLLASVGDDGGLKLWKIKF